MGPFVTHELVRRADGGTELYTARRHRKGMGPVPVGPHDDGGVAAARPPGSGGRPLGWWIAVLFMIGSALFAAASAPGVSDVVPTAVVGGTYFAGSVFFTAAAYLQFVETINAAPGRRTRLVAWQPATIGWWSAVIQLAETLWFNLVDVAWRIVWINLAGSVFFMIAALAAFVRPATGDPVGAAAANGGTFLGALCFLWGARLLLVESAEARAREQAGA